MSLDREAAAPDSSDSGERFKHEIASDVAISGRIAFPGNARIEGRLSGEVRADALLVVAESAILRATVRAQRLILFGTIEGDVRQSDSVELKPGSRLVGNLEARRLTVHPGAFFQGRCSIGKRSPAKATPLVSEEAKVRQA